MAQVQERPLLSVQPRLEYHVTQFPNPVPSVREKQRNKRAAPKSSLIEATGVFWKLDHEFCHLARTFLCSAQKHGAFALLGKHRVLNVCQLIHPCAARLFRGAHTNHSGSVGQVGPANECVSLVRYQANLLIRRVVSWPANSHSNTFQCRSVDSSLRPGIERVAPSALTQWLRPITIEVHTSMPMTMTNARQSQRGARAGKKICMANVTVGGRRRVCIGVGCLWRTHYVMMRPFHLSSCRRVQLTNLETTCNTTLAKFLKKYHLTCGEIISLYKLAPMYFIFWWIINR